MKKQNNCKKKKCFSDCFTNRNFRESIGRYNVYLYLSYSIHFTYTRQSQFMRFMYLSVFYNAVPYYNKCNFVLKRERKKIIRAFL